MNMKNPFFSIIIPCYNSEKTIGYAIESILEQKFTDYEIICLDDGSTDGTYKIIESFSRKSEKIKLLHHSNHGVGYTRNRGLNEANGQYVLFLDSDDWLHYRALSIIFNDIYSSNIDCYIYGVMDVSFDGECRDDSLDKLYSKFHKRPFSFNEAKTELIYIFGGLSTKVFKRTIFIENELFFEEKLKSAEDLYLSLYALSKCHRILINNVPLYFYRKELTKTLTLGHISNIQESLDFSLKKLEKIYPSYLLKDRFLGTMLYVVNREKYDYDKESFRIISKLLHSIPSKRYNECRNVKRAMVFLRLSLFDGYLNIKKTLKSSKSSIKNFFKDIYLNNIRKCYKKNIKRLRCKYNNNEKITVAFIFNEFEKIKTESLINDFLNNKKFKVIILITSLDSEFNDRQKETLKQIESFCIKRNLEFKKLFNSTSGKAIPIDEEDCDIIFYQQPWNIHKFHEINRLCKRALLCYVPYFVPNKGNLRIDCQKFHVRLFRFYVLNKDYSELYKEYRNELNYNIRVVGHPALDKYALYPNKNDSNIVIYAPHWSIGNDTVGYSTFIWSGFSILDFAERHPEFDWIFRPHPRLFSEIKKKGLMSQIEIDNYLYRWSQISNYDSSIDYIKIFARSKCLITDCGSFLTEYFPTGKPVIYMVNDLSNQPCDPLKTIVNQYYNVFSSDELLEKLEELLIKGEDQKKIYRCENARLFFNKYIRDNSSSKRIVKDIEEILSK